MHKFIWNWQFKRLKRSWKSLEINNLTVVFAAISRCNDNSLILRIGKLTRQREIGNSWIAYMLIGLFTREFMNFLKTVRKEFQKPSEDVKGFRSDRGLIPFPIKSFRDSDRYFWVVETLEAFKDSAIQRTLYCSLPSPRFSPHFSSIPRLFLFTFHSQKHTQIWQHFPFFFVWKIESEIEKIGGEEMR